MDDRELAVAPDAEVVSVTQEYGVRLPSGKTVWAEEGAGVPSLRLVPEGTSYSAGDALRRERGPFSKRQVQDMAAELRGVAARLGLSTEGISVEALTRETWTSQRTVKSHD